MNDAVDDFIQYLVGTKKYSEHTATAYEKDIMDFVAFWENFSGNAPHPNDLARADTICFRSFLADRQRRGLSHKSTARTLSALRGFYKFLGKKYGITNDAIELISSRDRVFPFVR